MTAQPDYAALFAASPYPYLLVDTGFIIIGANPAYLASTGRAASDIVGKHIFDAFPADPSDPESTNLAEVRASIEQAIHTKQPHTSALLRYAVPRRTPEGTVFDARFWSAVHTPVFDAHGDVAYVAQNAIDVTDLYRFDPSTNKYYLKQDANAVPDIPQMNGPRLHEAMTRILTAERSALQTLFDQAPGFIAILTGPRHVFDVVNEAYYQLVGHRDILGKSVVEALPDLAGQGFETLLDKTFQSGEPIVIRESRISLQRAPDGAMEDRYIDLLLQPIVGADKRVTGIFAQGNDVTDAYYAHQGLSEKIQLLEEVKANQAFQLQLADRIRQAANLDEVTEAACALLGRKLGVSRVLYAQVDDTRGTLFVRRDWTADSVASLAGSTQLLGDYGPAITAGLRTGTMVVNNDVTRDHRTDRHQAPYEKTGVRAAMLLPFVKAGQLKVVLMIQSAAPRVWQLNELALVQEMAERTWSAVEAAQAQDALRTERDQSQYIFDSMDEGFAVLDDQWTILRMNAEGLRLSGLTAAQVIGRNHWDVWPELLGTPIEAAYRRAMATGKTEVVEVPHSAPDGTPHWREVRAHGTINGGIAFFFRDVTLRRQAQEELTTAARRKDEFLAMLAHELRNPLAPIGAAAELLQVAQLDAARIRRTSEIIGRQVRHMTSLVDDLLDVSRVTRGLVTLHRARVDAGTIVDDAVEQVMPLLLARRHTLRVALAQDTPQLDGDPKRLVQVLANLLSNAAKYTPEGGTITVSSEVEAHDVLLHVADNGIGMVPELVASAFDLFTQAERSSDRSAGGLGLGLALVESMVGLHGGTVHCASPGLGQGSLFTVRLPRPAPEAAGSEGGSDAAPGTGHDGAMRIMVVDDNVDAAAMLAMLLEAGGHHVHVEYGARAALARSETHHYDVFLLDIGLPDIDGNELARRLRAGPMARNAVLVAVTGYGQEQDRAQTAAAGFDHHLVKPVDIAKLQAILAAVRTPARRG
jgi:PAS domain S-box-containing protein